MQRASEVERASYSHAWERGGGRWQQASRHVPGRTRPDAVILTPTGTDTPVSESSDRWKPRAWKDIRLNASCLELATYKHSSPNSVSYGKESRKDDDRNNLEHDGQDSAHDLNYSKDLGAFARVVWSKIYVHTQEKKRTKWMRASCAELQLTNIPAQIPCPTK